MKLTCESSGNQSVRQNGAAKQRQGYRQVALEKIVGKGIAAAITGNGEGGLSVEFVHQSAPSLDEFRETGGWINAGGGPNDQQQVAIGEQLFNLPEASYLFAEQDNVGFIGITAKFARRYFSHMVVGLGHRNDMAALQTVQMLMIAVNLENIPAPGRLMKIVHVLGDQSLEESIILEFGKYPVSIAWLFADQSLAHFAIQLPGFLRIVEKDVEGCVFIRRKDGPYSTWAAEVGDTAGN